MNLRLVYKLSTIALCCHAAFALAEGAPDREIDAGLKRIEHIVVIYAENRSFDNLYGLFPGANGISRAKQAEFTQTDHDGRILPRLPKVWSDKAGLIKGDLPNRPFRLDEPPFNQGLDVKTPDLVHRYYQNIEQINGGKLDRYAALSDAGGLTMSYYDGSKMPMWKYAKEYVLADNFFMAAFGGSFLNHFWLVCACTPYFPDAPDKLKAQLGQDGKLKRHTESPASALDGPPKLYDNELTPDGYAVNTMQPPYQPSRVPPAPGGDPRYADAHGHPLPPQNFTTIGDTLSAKGVSWAWYAGAWQTALADGMQASDARRQVIYSRKMPSLEAHHQPLNYFARFAPGTPDRERHLKDGSEFIKAIESGKLPQVAFYKPESSLNEHPGYADVLSGDAHIAQLIAKLQASPAWAKTAIIVTYDENGGLWDHVPPPAGEGWSDRWGPGTRIPAIIISPFAKRGYIDSTPYDTTSILKFITRRFGLEPLPGVRKNAGDMVNAFDFGRR
ncbi:MAG: acid phosphatase [Proteobacteria bacterium]|nr:acid phosphatase [Pseudomonadota bacterium]